jgi:hypothetical protein
MSLTDCTLRACGEHIFWYGGQLLRLLDPRCVRIGNSTERKKPGGAIACLCNAGTYTKLCLLVMLV